jgi:hypothetical protein
MGTVAIPLVSGRTGVRRATSTWAGHAVLAPRGTRRGVPGFGHDTIGVGAVSGQAAYPEVAAR